MRYEQPPFGRSLAPLCGCERAQGVRVKETEDTMKITAFEAEVTVLGKGRKARFDGDRMVLEGIDFSDVHWLLAVLEGAQPTLGLAGTPAAPQLRIEQTVAGALPAAAPPASTSEPVGAPAQTAEAAAPPKQARRSRATTASAGDAPAPPDPVGLAPPGENVDAPPRLAYDATSGQLKNVDTGAPVSTQEPERGLRSAPALAEAASAPKSSPSPVGTNGAGTWDREYVKGAAKLKDILAHLLEHGVAKEALAGICIAMKEEVGLLARIPNIEERVARTLEVMGQ